MEGITANDIRNADALVLHPSVKSAMERLLDADPYDALKRRPTIISLAGCPKDQMFLVNDDTWEQMQEQLHEAIQRMKEQDLI